MFIRRKKTEPEVTITYEMEREIIRDYLKQCAEAYKFQPITAERMIEMELQLLDREF